jgi:hypothetical protein
MTFINIITVNAPLSLFAGRGGLAQGQNSVLTRGSLTAYLNGGSQGHQEVVLEITTCRRPHGRSRSNSRHVSDHPWLGTKAFVCVEGP